MKKVKLGVTLGVLFVALSTMISCNENEDSPVLLKAYLKADGNKELVVGEKNQTVNAKIVLTDKVAAPLTVRLKMSDKKGAEVDFLNVSSNELVIPKGSNEVAFKITLKDDVKFVEEKRVVLSLMTQDALTVAETLEVVVKPALAVQSLTPEQRKLVEGYIKKGMDITPFLGKVKVKTTIISAADGSLKDFAKAFTKETEGVTVIELSEKSTAELPVLKMTENPMGMTEFFYYVLKKETIENDEYWYGEYAGPYYAKVMQLINWNKTSKETFSAVLDGLKLKGNNEIDYIGKGKDSYGEEIDVVPFEFSYSAWDRLKKLIDEGNAEAKEYHEGGATPRPANYLNNTTIAKDEYEKGAFKPTTGRIDFNKGTMTFEFLTSHAGGADYLVIKAEYGAK